MRVNRFGAEDGFAGYFLLFVLIVLGFGFFHGFYIPSATERADMPSGMPELLLPPVQTTINPPPTIQLNGFTLSEVASYEVTARILSMHRYLTGDEAALSPVDLALGWGLMADRRVLGKLDVTQSGRFYHWYASEYPINPDQIEQGSANTHIIPANDRIDGIIKGLRRNQVVTMTGYLVNAKKPDGWHWESSLSRKDTGMGACEVFLVEDVRIR